MRRAFTSISTQMSVASGISTSPRSTLDHQQAPPRAVVDLDDGPHRFARGGLHLAPDELVVIVRAFCQRLQRVLWNPQLEPRRDARRPPASCTRQSRSPAGRSETARV